MTTQSEAQLEKEFISKLNGLGYSSVSIADESDLLLNLKEKIEGLNDIKLSDLLANSYQIDLELYQP